jgi:glutamate dehydrogenase/leucine dehydrogenase
MAADEDSKRQTNAIRSSASEAGRHRNAAARWRSVQETKMARFDFKDSSVVVIIGSGAGGGTLANELCQKGVKVVVLEAGGKQSTSSFVNDEWEGLQPAGVAGQAHHLGQLARGQGLRGAARVDLQDGGRHQHPLGRRLVALPAA